MEKLGIDLGHFLLAPEFRSEKGVSCPDQPQIFGGRKRRGKTVLHSTNPDGTAVAPPLFYPDMDQSWTGSSVTGLHACWWVRL